MADKKISELTASSTPLAGTEVLPIVQSTSTVKVAVSNLTVGRNVSMAQLEATGNSTIGGTAVAAQRVLQIQGAQTTNTVNSILRLWGDGTGTNTRYADIKAKTGAFGDQVNAVFSVNNGDGGGQVDALTLTYDGNANVNVGNLIIGTSGKGIDFSATSGTGTSELLADYEEGTWTPAQGAGLTVIGAFSSSGTYTKVGRIVTIAGKVTGATSVACSAIGVITNNLPFTSNSFLSNGGVLNISVTSQGLSFVLASSTSLFSAITVTAATDILFSATYSV